MPSLNVAWMRFLHPGSIFLFIVPGCKKRIQATFIIFAILTTSAHAYQFTSSTQEKRFEFLTKTIRCVVCQNQSIADSNAPLANDLKNKVYKMVLEEKSDTYIQDYLVKRYGEFILLQPRFSKLTILLWSFPFLALGIVFLVLIRLLFKRSL